MKAVVGAVLAVALVGLASAAGDPNAKLDGVHDITPANFETVLSGSKAALVEFYAPWCGHCKHLVPEYKKLGSLIAADPKLSSRVIIAKVDADAHRSLGEKFDVKGFPTIKFFPSGKAPSKDTMKDYAGARTADAFLSYIKAELEADKSFARVEALDALAKGFAEAKDKKAILTKVKAAVDKLEGEVKENGAVYVKVLEKAIEKGDDYLSKEKSRLDKMLSGGSVASNKADEFAKKLSVITGVLGDDE